MGVTPALELHGVARTYRQGKSELEIFRDLDFSTRPGEVTALVGPSGAGKSSLLHIAGLLEAPSAGDVFVAGRNCTALNDAARTRIRRYLSAHPISSAKSPDISVSTSRPPVSIRQS